MLERLDPNPEYWEGKRGACVGLFQLIIAGREDRQALVDIIQILKNTSNPQVSPSGLALKKLLRKRMQLARTAYTCRRIRFEEINLTKSLRHLG